EFVGGVGAIANGAQAVDGRDAEGGGEVAVAAAAGAGLAQVVADLRGEAFGQLEALHDLWRALHGRPVQFAAHEQAGVGRGRGERLHGLLDTRPLGLGHDAHVHFGARFGGDDVAARAALHDADVHAGAALEVVEGVNLEHLVRQLDVGAAPTFGVGAGVRGAPFDRDGELADAFAPRLEGALRTDARLEHEHALAAARFVFAQRTAGAAACFLVAGHEQYERMLRSKVQVAQ